MKQWLATLNFFDGAAECGQPVLVGLYRIPSGFNESPLMQVLVSPAIAGVALIMGGVCHPCVLTILCLLGSVIPVCADAAVQIDVIALNPQPNYPLTMDRDDAHQLTDGQARRFPFWTRRESVGWQKRMSVLVIVRAELIESHRYELLLRTGQRRRAGVQIPRRIDVYCGSIPAGAMFHVGDLAPDAPSIYHDGTVNLRVPFNACRGDILQVAVHAQGTFLMIDQLTIRHVEPDAAPSHEVRSVRQSVVADPLNDSRTRLEQYLLQQARQRLAHQLSLSGTKESQAWLDAAWSDLGGTVGKQSLQLARLPTERATWVIGIANTSRTARQYRVEQSPLADRAEVSYLPPLLSADGRLVFDALLPASSGHWRLLPGDMAYFWLREPAHSPAGRRWLTVSDDNGWSQRLEVSIDVLDGIRPDDSDAPRILVWSYTNDQPIWQDHNAEELVQAMTDAGVNVFVVPPQHIPLPFDGRDLQHRIQRLRSDLALYRGRGLVLLFTGGHTWVDLVAALNNPSRHTEIQRWATQLAEAVTDAGIASDQWALYPVDEMYGANLELLADLIEIMRAEVPDLQFFANPVAGRGEDLTRLADLRRLAPLVTYWQPRAGTALYRTRAVLSESPSSQLWLYDNPCEPARATSPDWYRALGRRAYEAGATGVGFWSFSATGGSSAWNDLDGVRPDWAVVYEADKGFVSSRRWEAFLAGTHDYAALKFCSRRGHDYPSVAPQCAALRRSLPRADTACRDWRRPQ